MDIDLTGKRALVCGSTAGIGHAAAVELALLGASVTLLARDGAKLAATAAGLPRPRGQAHATLVADFARHEEVRDVVRGAVGSAGRGDGAFQILVNNSGGPPPGPAAEATVEQFLAAFSAQLFAAHHLAQALLPGMRAARYGRIINVISTSVKQPIPNLGVSNTVRAAVANWAKTLAGEVAADGITVNSVLPGYTSTDRLAALVKGRAGKTGQSEEAVKGEIVATIPAGRFGRPEEVGAVIAFLATPAAAYVNGVALAVDGGRTGSL